MCQNPGARTPTLVTTKHPDTRDRRRPPPVPRIDAARLAALLPIVNPLGAAPVYLAKTVDLTPAEHADLARRVAINCFMLLLASLLVGAYVLDFFGLSVPIVQVAGGLVVCSLAWSLLHQPDEPIEWVHEAAEALSRARTCARARSIR